MLPQLAQMDQSFNDVNFLYNNLISQNQGAETTSFDGKPILNPFQFAQLSTLQLQNMYYSTIQNSLLTSMQNKMSLLRTFPYPNTVNLGKRSYDELSKPTQSSNYEPLKNQKKVKKDIFDLKSVLNGNIKNNLLLDLNVSTAANSNSSLQNSPILISYKDSLFSKNHANISEKASSELIKTSVKKRILKALFQKEKLFFEVKIVENGCRKLVLMSKEKILKEEPLLLVYFYERNLHFNNGSEFDQMKLKKIEE